MSIYNSVDDLLRSIFEDPNSPTMEEIFRNHPPMNTDIGSFRNKNHTEDTKTQMSVQKRQIWYLYDAKDNKIKIDNLVEFCKCNNMNYNYTTKLFSNPHWSHKGYTSVSKHVWKEKKHSILEKKLRKGRLLRTYELRHISGKTIRTNNLNKFCKENDLNQGNMVSVLKGRLQDHKGWTGFYL